MPPYTLIIAGCIFLLSFTYVVTSTHHILWHDINSSPPLYAPHLSSIPNPEPLSSDELNQLIPERLLKSQQKIVVHPKSITKPFVPPKAEDNLPPKPVKRIQSDKPAMTIPEIQATFHTFLVDLHEMGIKNKQSTPEQIWEAYHKLTYETLYQWDKEYLSRMPERRSDDSIFMSIASYRDENCLDTITNAYVKASNPQHLYIGLVQQNCVEKCRSGVLEGGRMEDIAPDDDCAKLFCESEVGQPHCEAGRVRTLLVNETESLGPYAARFFASKLWHGEPWYMQIDSHMTFANDWDSKSVSMLQKAPSNKPVLTHYPPPHTQKLNGQIGTRICNPLFADSDIEDQIVRLAGSENFDKKNVGIPRFAPFVAAGYYVAHAEFLSEVPFDPFLPWIFMGEEISMSARLWTAGYDLFSPNESVMGHIYVRRHKPKFWETFGRVFRHGLHNSVQLLVLKRVKHTLGYPENKKDLMRPKSLLTAIDEYGMGSARPLDDYMSLAGLNVKEKKVTVAKWCHEGVPPPGFSSFDHLYK